MNTAMLFTWSVESVLLSLLALLVAQAGMIESWKVLAQLILSLTAAVLLVGTVAMEYGEWAHSASLGLLAHTTGVCLTVACSSSASSSPQFAIELAFFCVFELIALGAAFSSASGPTALMFSRCVAINTFWPMFYMGLGITDLTLLSIIGITMIVTSTVAVFRLERIYHCLCTLEVTVAFCYYILTFNVAQNWPLFAFLTLHFVAQVLWLIYSLWGLISNVAFTPNDPEASTSTTAPSSTNTNPSAPYLLPQPYTNSSSSSAINIAQSLSNPSSSAFQLFYDIPLSVHPRKKIF
jgi:hypothetical protein